MELPLFEQTGELVRAMTPDELGEVRFRSHRRGVKVWFDTEKASPDHYEAQIVPRRHLDGEPGLILEIGFHAEHRDDSRNEETLARVVDGRSQWSAELGEEAVAGPFLGNEGWRRLSETWIEPDLEDPELPFELASRLVDYVSAVEPLLRSE